MAKYTIGIDYGSLSGRAVLANVADGSVAATAVLDYPHGVMSERIPGTDVELGADYALQHPQDYLDVISTTVRDIMQESQVSPDDVIGICIDFTACTALPVHKDGTPLCFDEAFRSNPHAYVKMWKHHAAQSYANRLNEIAKARHETWLNRYGEKISSEWYYPKLWQILAEAPEVYDAMDYFIEAADWITWMLCGSLCRNSCTAGYKAQWTKQSGDLPADFLAALNPRLADAPKTKLNAPVKSIGTRAGGLTPQMAKLTGLNPGIAVAVGAVDAHVSMLSAGITEASKMLAIIGTSTCHMMLGKREIKIPGMCGVAQDGIIPHFWGYESGQSCCGDHFEWFMKNCCPASITEKAKEQGVYPIRLIEALAEQLEPGQSGLVALDWWNGNRSVLVDVDLSGVFLGMTLATKPEEMYRALIEATAYGTRTIIENYRKHGLKVDAFYACGGISQKSPLTMQIYADVLNMEVKIVDAPQGPALGSAIFAAAVAGAAAGGYDDLALAAQRMSRIKDKSYQPIREHALKYDRLFHEYTILHDYFGRGMNDVMKRLKALKGEPKI